MENLNNKLFLDIVIETISFIGYYEGSCDRDKIERCYDTDSLKKKCEKFYDEFMKKQGKGAKNE